MNSISQVSNSIEAVNQILKVANKQNMDLDDKLMKFKVEQTAGKEAGKGDQIDVTA